MTKQAYLTFFEHLEELRKRLVISLVFVGIGTAFGLFYSDTVLKFLLSPIESQIDQVYFFSPAEAFVVKLKVAFLFGLLVTSPGTISQIWLFFSPALRSNEKRVLLPLIFVSPCLFLSGVLFCFYLAMPYALRFLIGMQTDFLRPIISVENYIDLFFGMLVAFGACFILPIFIVALAFWGILTFNMLNKCQRHAIVVIFVVAAVATPTPDIMGQMILALPLLLLFEISVLGSKLVEVFGKKKR